MNRLLEALSRRERNKLVALCETVELVSGRVLCDRDRIMTHAYFPLSCVISLGTVVDDHPPLEMALIGSEGMLGATLSLGVFKAPVRGVVQGEGSALRLSRGVLQRELRATPALLRILHRYQYVLTMQVLQNAACTHFHEIEPRLVRWLLMSHDRAQGDNFHLTHGFLADMLGVRRSGITIAAGALQARNLIRYSRGNISILDREGLEAASCECYAAMNAAYRNALGAGAPG